MQASGYEAVEECLDIIYAGIGKFQLHAKFTLEGTPEFTIQPEVVGDIQMWPKTPEMSGDTMICTFEVTHKV